MNKVIAYAMGTLIFVGTHHVYAAYRFSQFKGYPPIHVLGGVSVTPAGLTPEQIKKAYNLPRTGGSGTIAIIDAYDDSSVEQDLSAFSKTFNLPECSSKNGCFEKHLMDKKTSQNSGWNLETALDLEWAHAIAPNAKILLVEAKTPSGKNLLSAIDYVSKRQDVVAVSMSFGGAEFQEEVALDDHFVSKYPMTFFASSGDNGYGVSWPAASPNVVSVGGTLLSLNNDGSVLSEKAWSGSGGGVSIYEKEPEYQTSYSISHAQGMRAVPDVSYNADPHSGVSVYSSSGKHGGWYVVGGTSAGAPQWAGIKSLGLSADNQKFYKDKDSTLNETFFRDIQSGKNGDCGYVCTARKRYDYVTGLGSPLTDSF
jgi:subtilase family serine protease